jgi:hypothetical protein
MVWWEYSSGDNYLIAFSTQQLIFQDCLFKNRRKSLVARLGEIKSEKRSNVSRSLFCGLKYAANPRLQGEASQGYATSLNLVSDLCRTTTSTSCRGKSWVNRRMTIWSNDRRVTIGANPRYRKAIKQQSLAAFRRRASLPTVVQSAPYLERFGLSGQSSNTMSATIDKNPIASLKPLESSLPKDLESNEKRIDDEDILQWSSSDEEQDDSEMDELWDEHNRVDDEDWEIAERGATFSNLSKVKTRSYTTTSSRRFYETI